MKLITHNLPNDHNIFFFGDRHKGAVLSSDKGWNKLISMMNSPYDGCKNFGVDGGDMIEAIMVDDPRFSPEKFTEPLPLIQLNEAVKEREDIKDKLLTILMGNHERKLWRFGDITEEACNRLEITYGTWACKLTINDKHDNLMYKIFDEHGHKSINSIADDPIRYQSNLKLTLKRHLKKKAGDCAVMIKHHTHKLFVSQPNFELYLTDDTKRIKQHYTSWGQNESYIHPDARWYGNAGSFLRLYGDGFSSYAEIAEYDPIEIGFLILKVRNKQIQSLEPYFLDI